MMVQDKPPPPLPPPGAEPELHRKARLVLIIVLVGLGGFTLKGFIAALVWAAILAVAIGPVYRRAEARWPPGRHNILLPLLATLVVAVMFLLPFVLLGVQAARDAHDVTAFATEAMNSGIPEPAFIAHLPFGAAAVSAWWQGNIAEPTALTDFAHRTTHEAMQLPTRELGIALTRRVVTFFFTLVTLFFILHNARSLTAAMIRASERVFGPRGEQIAEQMVASIHGTVDGLVLVGLGEGLLLGIAFAVAGVPHPTLLGALTGVAAMIPFVIILMLAVAGMILLAQGAVLSAVAVVGFGFLVSFVADHFVRPGLIGGATKLPFLWVLLGILGGVETWGLIGLFVGPALMSALMLLWRELVRPAPGLDALVSPGGATIAPAPATNRVAS